MKKAKLEEISNHTSVPILAWDFHYEYLNELKVAFADLKKVKEISVQFGWNEEKLNITERIKEEVVLITDPNLKIIFASSGIKRMTGYTESEVLGNTPKMFQGAATSKTDLKEIKKAIELQIPFEKTIKNYKKDGRTYKCKISASPVFNLKGKLSHFIAFEKEDVMPNRT
ncbi:PAS domain-containing protein [Flavobacterium sp. Fl-318]|uniref:PAS domain-containing protein n=1 Tax=Flavobacterium cupriresistens TaxID=2893885 RepID=A0ABU4RET6_9FLAO|nr:MULTISPECIES: PAS domain-containing protein [unclassified Flavobacterium]MDX6190348.1 PAS domain-containing protein [Flavobacterium sp. Fl-318]UFH43415.1 PAS domain-containing protein [Flavobacterium sp. F-323]